MSATLPVLQIDPRAYERGLSCVHCGLCLAACPTYLETGHEADSPRGRIQLIRGLADGTVTGSESVRHHLDLCLDCRACETACPSGVVYHELIEDYHVRASEKFPMSPRARLARWFSFHIAVHTTRLKLLTLPLRLWRRETVWPRPLPELMAGRGKGTIGLFAGCVTSVLFDSVNRKAAELLAMSAAAVVAPRQQTCCGAIHYHNGDEKTAQAMARRNIDAFASPMDFLAVTAGGCGAMLKEYDRLLRDDPKYAQRAKEFSAKVRDITQVLVEIGLPPLKGGEPLTVTYHDACHLAHAQKVRAEPRALLAKIPGLKLVPLAESDHCCGAAGTYFLTQPEMARKLAARKLSNIAATGAAICVSGNAGCTLHLRRQAALRGQKVVFVHPVELLYAAASDGMLNSEC
jgi:glycolate oxidase iron-sulfur subunit